MKWFYALLTAALLLPSVAMAEIKVLQWEDLRPADEQQALPNVNPHGGDPFADESGPASWVQPQGQVVAELDGQTIKLPGFIVPLEGDETHVTEFLLVPYFGACVHVPPPPTNQLIYVKYEQGLPIDIIWDAVWVTGKLSTNSYAIEEFSAGYSMEATLANPYDEG
ncbi:DUF3299 domain-containing protein [Ferrimonas gelatinilytica]|uniref:DUF3299 domain-containing protein n=1 Tax=Ferrimonas gelatinilytica TaxID=1255257 RepID=A0ABP9RYN5_9GAMM